MNADFWNQRWQNQQIAFHQGRVNPLLDTHVGKLALTPGDRVFVPLCGKAIDMRWLIDQGYSVVGVELSPIAVRDFFTEHALSYQTRQAGELTVYENESKSLALWCGDFFSLSRDALGEFAAVYDRAALIALPDEMRTRYVDHLLRITAPNTPILLLTYEYPATETEGAAFLGGCRGNPPAF